MGHSIYAYDREPGEGDQQPVKPSVVWNGRRWWLNGGYYCNRRGELLHRAIYAAAHGPIPPGVDIHHKDGDKTNNALANLEAVTRSQHLHRHRPRGWRSWGREKRQRETLRQWQWKEPYERACDQCGETFSTTGTRSRFCSAACRARNYRATGRYVIRRTSKPRTCEHCGKAFRTYRADARYCSLECNYAAKQPSPRTCVVCGAEFHARDPRTECCSRACGYALRSRKRGAS